MLKVLHGYATYSSVSHILPPRATNVLVSVRSSINLVRSEVPSSHSWVRRKHSIALVGQLNGSYQLEKSNGRKGQTSNGLAKLVPEDSEPYGDLHDAGKALAIARTNCYQPRDEVLQVKPVYQEGEVSLITEVYPANLITEMFVDKQQRQ